MCALTRKKFRGLYSHGKLLLSSMTSDGPCAMMRKAMRAFRVDCSVGKASTTCSYSASKSRSGSLHLGGLSLEVLIPVVFTLAGGGFGVVALAIISDVDSLIDADSVFRVPEGDALGEKGYQEYHRHTIKLMVTNPARPAPRCRLLVGREWFRRRSTIVQRNRVLRATPSSTLSPRVVSRNLFFSPSTMSQTGNPQDL